MSPSPEVILYALDLFGTAVFAVVGAKVAGTMGVSPVIVVLMGAMTGTVGGMIREVLCNETPLVLQREVYATASLSGGTAYVLLQLTRLPDPVVSIAAVAVVFGTRLVAGHWRVHLPSFRMGKTPQ